MPGFCLFWEGKKLHDDQRRSDGRRTYLGISQSIRRGPLIGGRI
jgi:hypothetical protein